MKTPKVNGERAGYKCSLCVLHISDYGVWRSLRRSRSENRAGVPAKTSFLGDFKLERTHLVIRIFCDDLWCLWTAVTVHGSGLYLTKKSPATLDDGVATAFIRPPARFFALTRVTSSFSDCDSYLKQPLELRLVLPELVLLVIRTCLYSWIVLLVVPTSRTRTSRIVTRTWRRTRLVRCGCPVVRSHHRRQWQACTDGDRCYPTAESSLANQTTKLRGRLNRQHYGLCLFVRLSVCHVRAPNSKTKSVEKKTKIAWTFPGQE